MGLSDERLIPFIVDFGLAKRYRHPVTGHHIPFRQVQRIKGTPAFNSIHTHLGAEIGRRDDLESLAYLLIYLVLGSLPWLSGDRRQWASSILEAKQKTAVEVLCYHVPSELATFLTYTRTLSFSEEPDYNYIRALFSTLGREALDPDHDNLFDLLPLEPAVLPPAPSSSERSEEHHMPTPPPTSQRSRTTRRCKAAGAESTPYRARAAQQHQPGSIKIAPRLSRYRYIMPLFKISNLTILCSHFSSRLQILSKDTCSPVT